MFSRLSELVKAVQDLVPASRSAGSEANGTAVDTAGFDEATLVVDVGAITGSLDLKVQESDASGSGYADISGATITQITAANKVVMISIRCGGRANRKRFLKTAYTVGTTSCVFSTTWLLTRAENAPVTQSITPVQV